MTLAMFGYVCNDALIKRAAQDLPLFQSVFLRGCVLICLLALTLRVRGTGVPWTVYRQRPLMLRVFMETIGTVTFLLALTKVPLAGITAVMQLVPVAVTFAAARLLREKLSAQRVGAVVVGFIGVLFVIRPGTGDFSPWFISGLATVLIVVVRELATRRIPTSVPATPIALATGVSITLMGGLVSIFQGWQRPTAQTLALLVTAACFLAVGYMASIKSIRTGDISFSSPFRYSVMVFAIGLQIVVFGDVPDAMTFVGSAIVTAAGLYTLLHERSTVAFEASSRPSDVNYRGGAARRVVRKVGRSARNRSDA